MSNVANRVSAGPSIMEWMAEHYVLHPVLSGGLTSSPAGQLSLQVD